MLPYIHHLVCTPRPVTQRSPKIIDFLDVHFNVNCPCMSQASFGQHLLCMFNTYITVCPGKIKNRKLYFWPIFTCINREFDTGHPIHVKWLPLRVVRSRNSVYFVVRFTLSDERTRVTWQENSIGTVINNPAIFGDITRITHKTIFMHFVLLNHHVNIL